MSPAGRSIYLAGPTVFFRDPASAFQRLEAACFDHGLCPIRPAEPVDDAGKLLQGRAASLWLFRANTDRLRRAQGVLADLRPFRGELEPDSGTVFEVGFAYALGKPVAAVVTDTSSWGERIRNLCGLGAAGAGGEPMDGQYDMLIEDFGGPLNLMLAESCAVFTDVDQALAWLDLTVPHATA